MLPLAASNAGQELSATTQAPLAPAVGRRVLVVDDNVDAAETMAMLLDLSGYETRTAFSGREALQIACAYRPELVFLDIGMPGMNGFKVAQRRRADAATASALLVALTGWGTGEDLRKTKEAGFDAHLIKPAEPHNVEEILTRFLPMPRGIQA